MDEEMRYLDEELEQGAHSDYDVPMTLQDTKIPVGALWSALKDAMMEELSEIESAKQSISELEQELVKREEELATRENDLKNAKVEVLKMQDSLECQISDLKQANIKLEADKVLLMKRIIGLKKGMDQ